MQLQDIMSEDVETIAANAPLTEAAEQMKRQQVRHLLVTEGGAVVGVLSRKNLPRRARHGATATVRQVMSTPVVTAGPRSSIREAANLLRGHRIGCLPVVDDGRPVGMITVSDLLDLIGRGVSREPASSSRWADKHAGKQPRQYTPGR